MEERVIDLSNLDAETLEWKGYVKRALESIDKKLVSIDTKMDTLDECVSNLRIKTAALAGTISLAVSIIVIVVKSLLAR